MPANTISGDAAMFAIANHCGDVQYARVTSVTTPATVFTCTEATGGQNLAQTTNDVFNYGSIRLLGGSVYARIDDYVGSTRTFTLNGAGLVGIAAGNQVQFTGFNAQQYGLLFAAVNETIRESWGDFYVETMTDRADAVLTLASGTNEYSLPAACAKLLRIGIQRTTRTGIEWFDPMQIWRVSGEEGAYTLNFLPGFAGPTTPAWSSRVRQPGTVSGTFADAFANEPLCLHYIGREAELTSTGGTTKLPLNYVEWVGAEKYLLSRLAVASDEEKRSLNILLPQIQAKAAAAKAQLRLTKKRLPSTVELDF
jgi:hypothetical protein